MCRIDYFEEVRKASFATSETENGGRPRSIQIQGDDLRECYARYANQSDFTELVTRESGN